MMEEHGAEMSTRDKKDARRVSAAFEFQDTSSNTTRRRGGGPGGSGVGGREREHRDPQPQIPPRPISGSDSRRNRFGAHLTTEGDANDLSPGPSRHQTPSPPPPSMDPVAAEYAPLLSRCLNLLVTFSQKTIHGYIRAPAQSRTTSHQRHRGRQARLARLHSITVWGARPHLDHLEHPRS